MTTRNHRFVIVGAGPVGLTAAKLLSNAGKEVLIVERRPGPQRQPAAHVVNARTLEIFRQAGFDMDAIAAIATDPREAGHVNFLTALNGTLIGRLPFERQGEECLAHTPTPLRNISQHRLEPLLVEAVSHAPGVELRYGVEWLGSVETPEGVCSTLREVESGTAFEVLSPVLIGADGAGSGIRRWCGIEMIGPASIQSFVAIHFMANLRSLLGDRMGVLHFVMDPGCSGTFIAHDIDREWVFMTPFDPASESLNDFGFDRCADLVRRAMGDTDYPIEIADVGTWHMTAQVAEHMSSGRVFLVGDAAHRFPPTGGLGLNTGVGDASNLIWKLCAVDDGWAPQALLSTYETERHPVAEVNCEQSTTNAFKMVHLIDALQLTPDTTRDQLEATITDPNRREAIATAVADQATHFDMLGLQLGYTYGAGALVRDGDAPSPIADPSVFSPSGLVGERLPHGSLSDGRSTLDLIGANEMALLSLHDHEEWAGLLTGVSVPVTQVRLGIDVMVDSNWLELCNLANCSALLVRPDQHIAWRATEIVGRDQFAAVMAAVISGGHRVAE